VSAPEPELTGGEDRATEHVRRAVLRHLRDHGDGVWREIAGGVLDGTTTLRQVASSSSYREQLLAAAQGLLEHRAQVGEAAFEEEGRRAATVIDEVREQIRRDERGPGGTG
jgi:hypothetical protein